MKKEIKEFVIFLGLCVVIMITALLLNELTK
jgi:hypothetical protein